MTPQRVTDEGVRMVQNIVDRGSIRPTYLVRVLPDFNEAIRVGHYDQINPDVNQKNFPIEASEERFVEVALFDFDKTVDSFEVIEIMHEEGYRPAYIEHLFGLGVAEPDLQRKFPIVALSSVWRRVVGSAVPALMRNSSRRTIVLVYLEGRWTSGYRFLAIHT